MSDYILLTAAVILICLLLHRASDKLGIPMLLAFIVLGMVFGSDGFFKIPFDNYRMAEQICSFALIFIMFYGGFGTSWKSARPIAVKAVLLSSLGVVLTAAVTGLFCFYALGMGFWESMLIGSVISSTDAASVFSILRSRRLNLGANTAPMLEMESGSNDPFSYLLTIAVLSVIHGSMNRGQLAWMIFAQIAFGLLVGAATAFGAVFVLSRMKNPKDGVDTIFIFTIALLSYAGATWIGGNGYLSVYLTGILLGNRSFRNKIAIVHFFDGITGLMQILIFFLLGLLSFPSQLPNIAAPAFAIALFLTFAARPLAVFLILAPFRCPLRQMLLVSWAGLRGAASIVFAIVATVHPAYMKQDVFHIVFFIVLFSISIQGTLIPLVAKRLGMIDDRCNILKSFSDYTEETPIQFVKLLISSGHPWAGRQIKEIEMVPNLLLALILHEGERVIPNGGTRILEGDIVVLSALSLGDGVDGSLTELTLEKDSDWLGSPLCELGLREEKLIVAIKRGNQVLIPNGKTLLQEQDVLVISQLDS